MEPLTLVIANKRYSSWSMRPWLALVAASLPFKEELVPFHSPDFHARIGSPTGKVPLLRQGTLVIPESLAIAEYAAELAPEAQLWPRDQSARAIARAMSCEMHAGFTALRTECPMDLLRKEPGPLSDKARHDVARIQEIWRSTRAAFGQGGPFLFGVFSIADAMFAPVVGRFVSYGIEADADVRPYMDAILGFDAVQRWYADAQAERDWPRHPLLTQTAGEAPACGASFPLRLAA